MKTQERASGAEPLTAEVWKEKDDTEVRWLGGAGFFVRARGAALLIDPCLWIGADGRAETGFAPFYPPVLRPEEVPAGTAVLYTHSDEDHLGRRTAEALKDAAFYGPAPCARALSEIGREAERVIRPGEKFAVGCIEIEAIPADHGWQSMDVKKYGAPFGPEDCVGYILRTPHAKLLFPGDTRLMPQHRALPDDFDAMAFDVSADPWHMGARDGAASVPRQAAALPFWHLRRAGGRAPQRQPDPCAGSAGGRSCAPCIRCHRRAGDLRRGIKRSKRIVLAQIKPAAGITGGFLCMIRKAGECGSACGTNYFG